jgi:SAM-dependent methyltransferase
MDPKEYETMFAVEDRHWWYSGMQAITTRLLANVYPEQHKLQILDAGCGTGAAMQYMAPFGTVTGCDMSPLALHFCRRRGLRRLEQSWVTRLPFAREQFDLVTSFDVLCHRTVGNYRDALAEFHRVLKPGGRLFLRLPAYNWLRAHHDQVVHTVHRFTTAELRRTLRAGNFQVEKLSYANTLLFPLALGKRLAERFVPGTGPESDVQPASAWQNALLTPFLYAEARWLVHGSLPFGLTVVAIAKKLSHES